MAEAILRYYGISPWEIEVLYGYLRNHFDVIQNEIEPDEAEFVSKMVIFIPVAFGDAFFVWFEYRRWERIKALFKEMKRRRGSGNAIKIVLRFAGNPDINFDINARDKQWFDNSVEKIDVIMELLPYHMQQLPAQISEITYTFDEKTVRWRHTQIISGGVAYKAIGNRWKHISD